MANIRIALYQTKTRNSAIADKPCDTLCNGVEGPLKHAPPICGSSRSKGANVNVGEPLNWAALGARPLKM